MRALLVLLALAGCRQQANWLPDPQWTSVPITVRWDGIDPVFDGSLRFAMGAWNHAAGCDVLRQAADARVVVSTYDGTACGAPATLETYPGATAGTWRCSVDSAEVRFQVMPDIRSVYVIAAQRVRARARARPRSLSDHAPRRARIRSSERAEPRRAPMGLGR